MELPYSVYTQLHLMEMKQGWSVFDWIEPSTQHCVASSLPPCFFFSESMLIITSLCLRLFFRCAIHLHFPIYHHLWVRFFSVTLLIYIYFIFFTFGVLMLFSEDQMISQMLKAFLKPNFARLIYLIPFLLLQFFSVIMILMFFSFLFISLHNSGFGSASPSDSTRAREPDSSRRWDGAIELRNNWKPCPNGALEEGRGACLHPWLAHLAAGYRSSADPLCQGRTIHVNGTFPQLYNTLILQCMMYLQMAFYLPRPSWTQFNNCFSFTAICKIASNSQADNLFFVCSYHCLFTLLKWICV